MIRSMLFHSKYFTRRLFLPRSVSCSLSTLQVCLAEAASVSSCKEPVSALSLVSVIWTAPPLDSAVCLELWHPMDPLDPPHAQGLTHAGLDFACDDICDRVENIG